MTLVSPNVRSRQFTKSHLSEGLYKTLIRTDLDSGRKISTKILSVLMQKLGLRLGVIHLRTYLMDGSLYEIEFLTEQATPLPFRD